jgi:hypothetical protein
VVGARRGARERGEYRIAVVPGYRGHHLHLFSLLYFSDGPPRL